MRTSILAVLLLLIGGCSRGPTSLLFDLDAHASIFHVEIRGHEGMDAVFPLSSVRLSPDDREGTIVIVLADDAPDEIDISVRGLTQAKDAMVEWTERVAIVRGGERRVEVVLGAPVACVNQGCAECGDGLLGADEACDDGNKRSEDGCDEGCLVESGWACEREPSQCAPTTVAPVCGDGRVQAGEGCDDGDVDSGDGCSSGCQREEGFTCTGQPSVCTPIEPPTTCGDGVVEAPESCDDRNLTSGDGCSDVCALEPGFDCDDKNPSKCEPVCGDGLVLGDEQCDDGNREKDDGCSDKCQLEQGFFCSGEPTVCEPDCSLPCDQGCPSSGCCQATCTSRDCKMECPRGCSCDLRCGEAEKCEVECKEDSICNVNCGEAEECKKLKCKPNAQCRVECEDAEECDQNCERGSTQECNNDVLVCRMPCP